MFGDISAWMYAYLGGIRPLESHPGFAEFTVAPQLVDSLAWVRTEHDSPYGTIVIAWIRQGESVKFEVTVPSNTRAHWTSPSLGGRPGERRILEAGHHVFTL
jgi:alpha-L-rhamnosidase